MGYQLFSDMTADVSEALMRGMPEVAYVPMQVELGGESFTYGPGGSLTVEQFYAEQRAGKFASTSQINPMIYRRCFEQALKAGEDVLYLCFSSGMSGTLQSANLCAEELREEYPARRLIVLDTLCASVGQAMLVREAARPQAGHPHADCAHEGGLDAGDGQAGRHRPRRLPGGRGAAPAGRAQGIPGCGYPNGLHRPDHRRAHRPRHAGADLLGRKPLNLKPRTPIRFTAKE